MQVMNRLKFAAGAILGLSIFFFIFFEICKHAPIIGAANPFAEDPYDAVGSFGIFLAFVCALLMVVRTFRPYRGNEIPTRQMDLAIRAGAVAVICVVVTLAADAIGLGRAMIANGIHPETNNLAAVVGGMTLVTLATGWTLIRAANSIVHQPIERPWWRGGVLCGLAILILAFYPIQIREASATGGVITALVGMSILYLTTWGIATVLFPTSESNYEDVFDDLSAIIRGWGTRSGGIAWGINLIIKVAGSPPVNGVLEWINPRKHRWNLAILAAAGFGVAIVSVEALSEGIAPTMGRVLLVVSVYLGIGGAGVMLGYLLFGKFLGIFRPE